MIYLFFGITPVHLMQCLMHCLPYVTNIENQKAKKKKVSYYLIADVDVIIVVIVIIVVVVIIVLVRIVLRVRGVGWAVGLQSQDIDRIKDLSKCFQDPEHKKLS